MKFEPKISGTTVTEFEIEPLFEHSCFSLQECIDKNIHCGFQELMTIYGTLL